MKNSRFIQRFGQPNNQRMKIDQAFGGAALQLKQEAWDILYDILTIEHMGAAEFEFGALPKTLNQMCHVELIKFSFLIKAKRIQPNWNRQSKARKERHAYIAQCKREGVKPKRAKPIIAAADRIVYVICPAALKTPVEERILDLAANKCNDLKRDTGFTYALDPVDERDKRTCGWLDLDNNFMFFTDNEMWGKMWAMFESFKQ